MELKLDIYEKRNVVKTYTTDTYDIMFGTVEDLVNLIELDKLASGDNTELLKLVGNVVTNGMDIIKPLLKDIFEGLTDDELRHTKIKDIITVVVEIVKFAIEQIGKGSNGKN
jgi:hypothetical protein